MREGALARPAIIVSCLLALVVPALAWWDAALPGRALLAIAFALLVPGTPLALLLVRQPRSLVLALVPALSIAALLLLSVAQVVAGLWSEPATASLLALVNVAAAPLAWRRTEPVGALPRPRLRRARILMLLALAAAAVLWWRAVATVDLDAAGATGIVAVLPWTYWPAIALAAVVAGTAILGRAGAGTRRDGPDSAMAALGVAALAIMITAFVGVADGGSPVGTAYVHVGFVDWISQTGTLREAMDARFSWPGFFTAAAALVGWAGAPDAMPLVVGFPVAASLLCIAPVHAIGMAVFRDRTVAWLGVLVFVLGNWVQQDYFAPQAVAFPLMLTVVAALLWQLGETEPPRPAGTGWRRLVAPLLRTPARVPGTSAGWAIGMELALLAIAAAIVVSHQLTPVALIVALMLLSAFGATRSRTLWLGVAIWFAVWFAFGAVDWWTGHLSVLIDGFGRVDEAVGAGVVERLSGDPAYQAMQTARIGWSALFGLAGLVGWWGTRGGRLPMTATAALVAAPVSLVLGQPYGGEVVLRVYLYALPILAVLAAGGIARFAGLASGAAADAEADAAPSRARERIATVALLSMIVAGAVGVTTARGVNVAFERTPADVLDAAEAVLWRTPTGSTVRPLATEGALRVARIGDLFHPRSVEGDGTAFERLLAQDPDVVFLTAMRERYEEITGGTRRGWYDDIATLLEASGRYRVTDRTAHVIVLERIPAPVPDASRPPDAPRPPEASADAQPDPITEEAAG